METRSLRYLHATRLPACGVNNNISHISLTTLHDPDQVGDVLCYWVDEDDLL